MKKYEKLKTVYPAYVCLEQLRIICKISKRSARYLVTNGIIPSIDSGKKTWRYKISIDDVITYLRRREQRGSLIPVGAANDCKTRRKQSFSQLVARGQEQEIVAFFSSAYSDTPDVLTVYDMSAITGLDKKTFLRIIRAGQIKVLARYPRYVVSKLHFFDFVASRRFIDLWSNSESFIKALEGFKVWKAEKSVTE